MHIAGDTRERSDQYVAHELSAIYSEQTGRADYVASILGGLTSLGVLGLVATLVTAGAILIDYQPTFIDPVGAPLQSFAAGLTVVVLVTFVSLLVGGFAAGRMSRYSGGLNGMGAGLWILLFMIVLALGGWVASGLNMVDRFLDRVMAPDWIVGIEVSGILASPRTVVASAVLAVTLILGGYVGGRLGERYHRRLDMAIVEETVRP